MVVRLMPCVSLIPPNKERLDLYKYLYTLGKIKKLQTRLSFLCSPGVGSLFETSYEMGKGAMELSWCFQNDSRVFSLCL